MSRFLDDLVTFIQYPNKSKIQRRLSVVNVRKAIDVERRFAVCYTEDSTRSCFEHNIVNCTLWAEKYGIKSSQAVFGASGLT